MEQVQNTLSTRTKEKLDPDKGDLQEARYECG